VPSLVVFRMVDLVLADTVIVGFALLIWTIVAFVAAICVKLVSIQGSVNTIRDTAERRRLFRQSEHVPGASDEAEDR